MPLGTVTFFNGVKGFGFIAPDRGGKQDHVHGGAVSEAGLTTLRKNQRIRYDLRTEPDGKAAAVNLRLA